MPAAGLLPVRLVDGLALHGATWPERCPPERRREVLQARNAALFRSSEQGD